MRVEGRILLQLTGWRSCERFFGSWTPGSAVGSLNVLPPTARLPRIACTLFNCAAKANNARALSSFFLGCPGCDEAKPLQFPRGLRSSWSPILVGFIYFRVWDIVQRILFLDCAGRAGDYALLYGGMSFCGLWPELRFRARSVMFNTVEISPYEAPQVFTLQLFRDTALL